MFTFVKPLMSAAAMGKCGYNNRGKLLPSFPERVRIVEREAKMSALGVIRIPGCAESQADGVMCSERDRPPERTKRGKVIHCSMKIRKIAFAGLVSEAIPRIHA